ncbi:MAG: hypothetical protein RLZZ214_2773 [Verrucomicrobiota bacterium]|jgi:uncharacterized membrane protein YebE (DUF533 family)
MNSSLLLDRRATGLLNRVREDVSLLRNDIGNLLSDTTHRTLPKSVHEISDRAKNQLAAGSAYATSRIREIGRSSGPSACWIGGALALGLVAYGAYSICRNNCASRNAAADGFDTDDDNQA